jgi:alpha-beta hydrolase superfamily lysophospholipase
MSSSDGKEWLAYYERFPYFSTDTIREGCHPRVFEHEAATGKAIVLCHGLTDSPHFLAAIARHFHINLGYDVYLPLLHGHGLKDPKGMEGVALEEWKANIGFAVDTAAGRAEFVSVGGLSTGGTLSFYTACTNPKVTGDLYLFSAALDLAGGPMGLIGEMKERILRTFLADLLDNQKPLIGRNPYRYDRMDMDGAKELARLIKETDSLLSGFDAKTTFPRRVFAVHSESDKTADINGIRNLQKKTPSERFTTYFIPKAEAVSHASLVLEEPIFAIDSAEGERPLEKANPKFAGMMEYVAIFEKDVKEAEREAEAKWNSEKD